jgi:hypothetical protein
MPLKTAIKNSGGLQERVAAFNSEKLLSQLPPMPSALSGESMSATESVTLVLVGDRLVRETAQQPYANWTLL